MEKRILGVLSAGLFMALVVGAANARPVRTSEVSYRSGADTIKGYLALPATGGRHPALVVIPEWWGLNDQIKGEARRFAGQGYVALAVDLYRGKVATTPGEAHELARGLPQDRGVRDLRAAFDYLASRRDVNPQKIGSVGWCMGGGYSLLLAENELKLAACLVNYGAMPTDAAIIDKIHAPVLGNFGADDHGITPDDVHAFEKAMKAAGKSIDVKVYDGAGHAFENPDNKNGYRPVAAEDAWNRMINFLAKTLK